MPRLPSQLTYNDLNGAEAVEILTDWFRHLLQSQPQFQAHLTLPMAKITLDIGVAVDMFIGGTVPVASPPERLDVAGSVTLDNSVSGRNVFATSGHAAAQASTHLSTVVNSAPIPGGSPPDQVREQHNLPVSKPGYGPRDTGSHLFLSDLPVNTPTSLPERTFVNTNAKAEEREAFRSVPDRQGDPAPGYVFSSEPTQASDRQVIPLDQRGKIEIDFSGEREVSSGGATLAPMTNIASLKEFGDARGAEYGSVSGIMDPGPAGLRRRNGQAGLYGDGRARLSFGNTNRG